MWCLEAEDKTPEDLNLQVTELLSRLTPDLGTWRNLSSRFHVDLFCGLFMNEGSEGLSLSPSTMADLGARCIEIGLDIYAPVRDISATKNCPCGSGETYGECCGLKSSLGPTLRG
jgi:uncharacterized protein DUF4279/SEC-C motif-containing protein